MRAFHLVTTVGPLCTMLAPGGCGDDSGDVDGGMDAAVDTGPPDTGRDSSVTDTGVRDSGTDTGLDAGEPEDECDPFTGGECADGEKCSLVINRNDPENFILTW